MDKLLYKLITILCFLLVCIGVAACGGGTAGSGTEPRTRFAGAALSKSGEPLTNATITLLNENVSAQTDEEGAFELDSNFAGGDAAFELITSDGQQSTFDVPEVSSEAMIVNLTIVYDSSSNTVQLSEITAQGHIVGDCDPFFLNNRTILQTGEVPEGKRCTAELTIRSGGQPVDGVEFALEHRSCPRTASWHRIDTAKTGTSDSGSGQIDFEWSNQEAFCVYRLRGPLGVPNLRSLSVRIQSLRKLEFDRRHKK